MFFVHLFSTTKHCLGVHRDGDGTDTVRHNIVMFTSRVARRAKHAGVVENIVSC